MSKFFKNSRRAWPEPCVGSNHISRNISLSAASDVEICRGRDCCSRLPSNTLVLCVDKLSLVRWLRYVTMLCSDEPVLSFLESTQSLDLSPKNGLHFQAQVQVRGATATDASARVVKDPELARNSHAAFNQIGVFWQDIIFRGQCSQKPTNPWPCMLDCCSSAWLRSFMRCPRWVWGLRRANFDLAREHCSKVPNKAETVECDRAGRAG